MTPKATLTLASAALALLCSACATSVLHNPVMAEDALPASPPTEKLPPLVAPASHELYVAIRELRIDDAKRLAENGAPLSLNHARALYGFCADSAEAEEFLRPLFPEKMPRQ